MAAPTPRWPTAPQTTHLQVSPRGARLPITTGTTTLAANLFARAWQCGGIFQSVVPVTIGALVAGNTTTIATPFALSPPEPNAGPPPFFPSAIQLGIGAVAIVLVSVALVPWMGATVAANPIIGTPYAVLAFSQGSPGAGIPGGGALFTIVGPVTCVGPILNVTLPIYAPANYAGGTVGLAVWAGLFGVPS